MAGKKTSDSTATEGNVPQFPRIGARAEDANPAIRLFGRRFLKEQTDIEYLIEFLLLLTSDKTIGEMTLAGADHENWHGFPTGDQLLDWPEKAPLGYSPKPRLMLKLFAFLANSNLETRHECHREKHRELIERLRGQVDRASRLSPDDTLSIVEKVLVGFIGLGGDRTWCTHSFIPLAPRLIAGESIWKRSAGLRNPGLTWEDAWDKKLFTFTGHDFLCRGGEILYLQLCNVFQKIATDPETVRSFEAAMGHPAGTAEGLRDRLENGLKAVLGNNPAPMLDQIAGWVEAGGAAVLPEDRDAAPRAQCGWCPSESWPEGYLFGYELANIAEAMLDPIEKVEMLKLCCIFQVLRTLSAQAARYWPAAPDGKTGMTGYAWIVTAPDTRKQALKEISHWNLIRVQEMIHDAIRTRHIQSLKKEQTYKKGDEQSSGLFLMLAKKIGFVVPYKGPGARFVLNEHLARYFVLALLRPGRRMTLKTFQSLLFRHYRAAIDGDPLAEAIRWTNPRSGTGELSASAQWFEELLRATGFLIPLSDAVSLVQNPLSDIQSTQRNAS